MSPSECAGDAMSQPPYGPPGQYPPPYGQGPPFGPPQYGYGAPGPFGQPPQPPPPPPPKNVLPGRIVGGAVLLSGLGIVLVLLPRGDGPGPREAAGGSPSASAV